MTVDAALRIPLTSDARDVQQDAASRGRASLYFFLTAILGIPCPLDLASAIQAPTGKPFAVILPRLLLRSFASDILLWTSISRPHRLRVAVEDVQIDSIVVPDPVKWLYGTFAAQLPCRWAPDIVLTSHPAWLGEPYVLDARRIW